MQNPHNMNLTKGAFYRIKKVKIISNKVKRINLRVTEKEYQKIEKKAQKAKMNISQYVSLSALDRDIVVIDDLKELIRQLSKVGNNINQATMLAHQGKIKVVDLSSVKKVVEDVWQ